MAIKTLGHPGRQATCARRVWPADSGVEAHTRALAPSGAMRAFAYGAAGTIDPTGTNDQSIIRNQCPRST